MPIIVLKAIEELPIPLSLPPCVNRRESFLARVIQGGGHGGYGDDISFYHHSKRVEGITFPSALVSKFSSLLIDEHQAAPVEDNKKTNDFLFKAQVSFHFPMPCPPYSTDPLNVNALPPWPRRSNHSSIFVTLAGLHLTKMSMSQLYRLNDRTFWFFPFMSVTNDMDCPPQFVGYWRAIFEYDKDDSEERPFKWILAGLQHHHDECVLCFAKEVGNAGVTGENGRRWFKQCSRCKCVKYCNVTCQKRHWSEHKKSCLEASS